MPTTKYASRLLLQAVAEPTEPAPTNLTEKLEQVRHQYLNLSAEMNGKTKCSRPDLSVWPSTCEDMTPAIVCMAVAPTWGQQQRFADMTPDEARILGRYLIDTADLVDREVMAQIEKEVTILEHGVSGRGWAG